MFCFSLASVLTETVIDVYSTTASSRGFTSHLIGTADFQSGASYSTAFRNNPIPDRVRITSGSDATGWYTVYPGATYETPCSSGAGTGCNSVSLRLNPVSGSPKHPTLFTSSLLAMAAESASTSASIARPCHSRATATAGKRATRWGRQITRIVSAPYAAGAAGGPTRWSDGVTWPPRCSSAPRRHPRPRIHPRLLRPRLRHLCTRRPHQPCRLRWLHRLHRRRCPRSSPAKRLHPCPQLPYCRPHHLPHPCCRPHFRRLPPCHHPCCRRRPVLPPLVAPTPTHAAPTQPMPMRGGGSMPTGWMRSGSPPNAAASSALAPTFRTALPRWTCAATEKYDSTQGWMGHRSRPCGAWGRMRCRTWEALASGMSVTVWESEVAGWSCRRVPHVGD